MKIALAHDYFNQIGGAERVVKALAEIFPDAPIYTAIYDEKLYPELKGRIRTSFMQRIPGILKLWKLFWWLYPRAFESFDLSDYDVVISSGWFAKGVKIWTNDKFKLHIWYCHSPMRFVWFSRLPFMGWLRFWDLRTAKMTHIQIANSKKTARNMTWIYDVPFPQVIYPPVDTKFFRKITPDSWDREKEADYYLMVGRKRGYKNFKKGIEWSRKRKVRCEIISGGINDTDLLIAYNHAKAILIPGEEDFSLVAAEAMACGTCVIFMGNAGAKEIQSKPIEDFSVEKFKEKILALLKGKA